MKPDKNGLFNFFKYTVYTYVQIFIHWPTLCKYMYMYMQMYDRLGTRLHSRTQNETKIFRLSVYSFESRIKSSANVSVTKCISTGIYFLRKKYF